MRAEITQRNAMGMQDQAAGSQVAAWVSQEWTQAQSLACLSTSHWYYAPTLHLKLSLTFPEISASTRGGLLKGETKQTKAEARRHRKFQNSRPASYLFLRGFHFQNVRFFL